jgi:hypothetical protein
MLDFDFLSLHLPPEWRKPEVIVQAAGVIATLAAVWTSLYLARRQLKPRIKIQIEVVAVADRENLKRRTYPMIIVMVANQGHYTVVVRGIYWLVRRLPRHAILQQDERHGFATNFPYAIEPGCRTTWCFQIHSASATYLGISGELRKLRNFFRWTPRLTVEILTDTFETARAQVPARVRRVMIGTPGETKIKVMPMTYKPTPEDTILWEENVQDPSCSERDVPSQRT